MILSSYFATANSIQLNDANKNLPIHIFHGVHDPVVSESLAQEAIQQLNQLGFSPSYKTYPIDHSVSPEEITDIAQWLLGVLQK
jgi:phospholipase/carboxylesterase